MANQLDRALVEQIKWNGEGLIPAVVQDNQSKAVLMLAYMNPEAFQKTVETGEAWFWSRSRSGLWHKGATSGNTQHIVQIKLDCDRDTLLLLVEPKGPACHRGTYSCFEEELATGQNKLIGASSSLSQSSSSLNDQLAKLSEIIARRDMERPEGAYTTYLFEKGLDKILKKVGEEASEVIIAAKNRDLEELSNESADLLYHLLVLWREQGLPYDSVLEVLRKRSEG